MIEAADLAVGYQAPQQQEDAEDWASRIIEAEASATVEEQIYTLIQHHLSTAVEDLQADKLKPGRGEWTLLPHQIPPEGDWDIWGMLGGRGAGKTKAGAKWSIDQLRGDPKARVGIGAPTFNDVRSIMIEGETGLLAVAEEGEFPYYNKSLMELHHRDGGLVKGMGSESADRWRGHNWSAIWADELASWNPEAWHMARMGLRLGEALAIFTTTPKNRPFIRELIEEEGTILTRATTYDNPHLAARALRALEARYKNTALGRQELEALFIDSAERALWNRDMIEVDRVATIPEYVNLIRIIIGVDPAVTANPDSAETGIIVVGRGSNNHGYVMADFSIRGSPEAWGNKVDVAYKGFKASKVIGEVNNGGDLIERNLRVINPHISYESVRASRGKAKRAEPVSSLYERHIVHHVGVLGELEDQMCLWEPHEPDLMPSDRLDAVVWALSYLFIDQLVPVGFKLPTVGKSPSKWMEN